MIDPTKLANRLGGRARGSNSVDVPGVVRIRVNRDSIKIIPKRGHHQVINLDNLFSERESVQMVKENILWEGAAIERIAEEVDGCIQ